jgi:phosphatidylserine decarboxylase
MALKLTPYGRREVAIAAAVVTALCALVIWCAVAVCPYAAALLVVPLGLWGLVVWFFRDPEREVPREPGVLLSPADGRVSDVTNVGAESPLGCEGVRIGVFMSVLDVHVNRAPCDGHVCRIERRKGAFLDARAPAAQERNESVTIHLRCVHDNREHVILVRQVAGLIARRIVTDLREGQELARGQRIGMIKFGSRLELWAPRELVGEVRVRVGDKVRAGLSVLIAARRGTA